MLEWTPFVDSLDEEGSNCIAAMLGDDNIIHVCHFGKYIPEKRLDITRDENLKVFNGPSHNPNRSALLRGNGIFMSEESIHIK